MRGQDCLPFCALAGLARDYSDGGSAFAVTLKPQPSNSQQKAFRRSNSVQANLTHPTTFERQVGWVKQTNLLDLHARRKTRSSTARLSMVKYILQALYGQTRQGTLLKAKERLCLAAICRLLSPKRMVPPSQSSCENFGVSRIV